PIFTTLDPTCSIFIACTEDRVKEWYSLRIVLIKYLFLISLEFPTLYFFSAKRRVPCTHPNASAACRIEEYDKTSLVAVSNISIDTPLDLLYSIIRCLDFSLCSTLELFLFISSRSLAFCSSVQFRRLLLNLS